MKSIALPHYDKPSNQLAPAAFRAYPDLAHAFEAIQHLGIGPVRLSGSGSTMYLLFDDPLEAAAAAATVETKLPKMKAVVARAPVGVGPVENINE